MEAEGGREARLRGLQPCTDIGTPQPAIHTTIITGIIVRSCPFMAA